MKRIFSVLAIAAVAMIAFSCKDDKKPIDDIDNIVEDGVYVMLGDKIEAAYAMAPGTNEAADQSAREGMYEKYIILDANQEFTLAYKAGDRTLKYGAELTEFTPTDFSGIYSDNPATPVLKGALVEGDNAPKMKAAKKALYHIVLDLNLDSKLDNAQILVAEAQYGVRGGMNSWGFTPLEVGELSNAGTTYTLTGQSLGNNGDFKFAYNGAWKITLDAEGAVKANTNLGWAKDSQTELAPGGANIVCADGAGKYKVTLTFKLAGGPVNNSFSYTLEQESKDDFPEAVYMIGAAWGSWDWANDGVVTLQHISAGGDPKDGAFVVTRYFKADDGFKFSTEKDWGKAFNKMGVDPETVTYDGDGNIHVPADGLYTITLDYTTGTMTLTEGMIYGMGPAFNDDWTKEKFPGVVNADGTATITALSAGALRVYAPCAFDWWQHEFQPTADGKIAYREGAELEGFAVEAGQVITFDFNAGTATVAAAWSWDDINETAGPESNTRIKGWKYYANASTIYILFRIDKTKIKSDSTLDWDPYIYIGLDTDNNATTGAAGGGGTMDGCEAQVCVFPWRGTTAAPECVNGEDANGWIKCPISGNSLATPTVYGKIEGDWCYEEVRIPRDLIGATAAGTIAFDASMSWYPLGRNEITLN
ncbi:MAG: SusF/SusE family outer membrane protein [Bacteroidales bacterium]|nr:SusF/SusE family outer membrane protein [Bacteroidales bacterium]